MHRTGQFFKVVQVHCAQSQCNTQRWQPLDDGQRICNESPRSWVHVPGFVSSQSTCVLMAAGIEYTRRAKSIYTATETEERTDRWWWARYTRDSVMTGCVWKITLYVSAFVCESKRFEPQRNGMGFRDQIHATAAYFVYCMTIQTPFLPNLIFNIASTCVLPVAVRRDHNAWSLTISTRLHEFGINIARARLVCLCPPTLSSFIPPESVSQSSVI